MIRLILLEPDILLETNHDGKGNWQFQTVSGNDEGKNKQRDSSLPKVSHVLISNVNLRYKDGVSGEQTSLLLENIEVDTGGLEDIFKVQITGSIDEQPIRLSAQLEHFDQIIAAQSNSIQTQMIQTQIEYGEFKTQISGQLGITSSRYMVDQLQLILNDNLFTGQVYYEFSNNKPSLDAKLYFSTLDLRKFLKGRNKNSFKRSSQKNKLFSAEKIDFTALRQTNANIMVTGKEIHGSNLTFNNLMLTAKLTDGLLKISPLNLELGGNKLQNTLTLDSRGKTAKFQVSSRGGKFNLGEILKKTDATDLVIGAPATVNISLKGIR